MEPSPNNPPHTTLCAPRDRTASASETMAWRSVGVYRNPLARADEHPKAESVLFGCGQGLLDEGAPGVSPPETRCVQNSTRSAPPAAAARTSSTVDATTSTRQAAIRP